MLHLVVFPFHFQIACLIPKHIRITAVFASNSNSNKSTTIRKIKIEEEVKKEIKDEVETKVEVKVEDEVDCSPAISNSSLPCLSKWLIEFCSVKECVSVSQLLNGLVIPSDAMRAFLRRESDPVVDGAANAVDVVGEDVRLAAER